MMGLRRGVEGSGIRDILMAVLTLLIANPDSGLEPSPGPLLVP
jgi:hypothetical protein